MDDLDLMESIVMKTSAVVSGVRPEQAALATPCATFDVRALVDHIVGYGQVFAAAANGETFTGDPAGYSAADFDEAAVEFRHAAQAMVDGWRSGGLDRTVHITGGEVPAAMALDMTMIEYLTHGWDLATATSQPPPYTDDEAADVLQRAQRWLTPEFRGEDKPFGPVVEVAADAPAIHHMIGFMGRHPAAAG
jgi:uncharacterized protein (TIGR03086 family)